MSRLEDKVAVISGGTSGIGLAIAQRFEKEGAHVFIFGRRRDALDEAVQRIGANVTAIQADASRLQDLDRVADAIRQREGQGGRGRVQRRRWSSRCHCATSRRTTTIARST